MLKPARKIEDRGHGCQIIYRRHTEEYDVTGDGGMVALQHQNSDGSGYHYDVLLQGDREEQMKIGAHVVASLMTHPDWRKMYQEAHSMVLEALFLEAEAKGKGEEFLLSLLKDVEKATGTEPFKWQEPSRHDLKQTS